MPYRHAPYFVGLVLLTVLIGFWGSYWAPSGAVPVAFHVHAITSITWLLLLIVQQVAIQRRHNALHKQLGLASFVLFPLLMAGFMMIVHVSAQRYAMPRSPFDQHNTPAFGIGTFMAMAGYMAMFYLALKHRRNVKLHAGYMLATPVILFESPFSRVLDMHLPWLNVIGSEGPQAVLDTILVSDVIATAFALGLYFMNRKHGQPWLLAACFTGGQGLVMWFAPFVPQLGPAFGTYAAVPLPITISLGLALGALAGWLGWRAGGPAPRSKAPAAA
ncbi:MAG: hypothetical protein ACK44O_15795 [Novosphingobium sp.]|jgi:hypothetical protein|uniref:hypothetical protein n=1 Tax=Novosphingobium sp. TaxID=1874826 RepID=UPI0039197CE0|nr:hypothetical protein [Novosphingobium sp.]